MDYRDIIVRAVEVGFAGDVREHYGVPFKRPDFTGDDTLYDSGFFWENLDGDRFYFDTFAEAAMDFANEIDLREDEARFILMNTEN
jgi:hypothetical protein